MHACRLGVQKSSSYRNQKYVSFKIGFVTIFLVQIKTKQLRLAEVFFFVMAGNPIVLKLLRKALVSPLTGVQYKLT